MDIRSLGSLNPRKGGPESPSFKKSLPRVAYRIIKLSFITAILSAYRLPRSFPFGQHHLLFSELTICPDEWLPIARSSESLAPTSVRAESIPTIGWLAGGFGEHWSPRTRWQPGTARLPHLG